MRVKVTSSTDDPKLESLAYVMDIDNSDKTNLVIISLLLHLYREHTHTGAKVLTYRHGYSQVHALRIQQPHRSPDFPLRLHLLEGLSERGEFDGGYCIPELDSTMPKISLSEETESSSHSSSRGLNFSEVLHVQEREFKI